jgi:membrane associated rhomboid family serine protease
LFQPSQVSIAFYVGNVLVATTADDHDIAVGASSMIYGMLGAYVAYMAINWTVLAEIRTQLCCIIGVMCFFFLLSSFGDGISFAGHAGGFLGGLLWGMAILPPVGTKNIYVTIAGWAGISIYLLTTFLVLFL